MGTIAQAYCANAAGENGPGENGWVSLDEWEAMPEGLKPLMAHRCHALGWDETQQSVRDRGACLSNYAILRARSLSLRTVELLHFPCPDCLVLFTFATYAWLAAQRRQRASATRMGLIVLESRIWRGRTSTSTYASPSCKLAMAKFAR